MTTFSSTPYNRRQGLTLLELLLVLGILVFLAAISGPALLRSLSGQNLDKGCEIVRAEMARARVQAIRTGKVQVFLFSPGGNQILIRDFDSLVGMGGVTQAFTPAANLNTAAIMADGMLPKGVTFISGEAAATFRSNFEMQNAPDAGTASSVLFYPDGTCQDARVFLASDRGEIKQVVVRGLTGTTRASIPASAGGN
jgi:prepilin-type N-terminal cleavage/methylation domain-containing protein